MSTDPRTRRAGFTLPEATMALVLLGLAAAGVLLPFSGGASVQAEGLHQTLAAKLASDLMERIVNTPAEEVVVRWNGYAEPPGQVRDTGNNVFTDPLYAHFSRQATCDDQVYVPQQYEPYEYGPPFPPNFILVSVQVCYQGREVATVTRLISR